MSNFCNLVDCSPPESTVHGIFQARILEWVTLFLFQGIFPTQGLNTISFASPALAGGFYSYCHLGSPSCSPWRIWSSGKQEELLECLCAINFSSPSPPTSTPAHTHVHRQYLFIAKTTKKGSCDQIKTSKSETYGKTNMIKKSYFLFFWSFLQKGVEEGIYREGQIEDARNDGIRCQCEWEEGTGIRSKGKG